MTFKAAVEQTPHLENSWKVGLGALRPADKLHIKADDTRRLRGSVDLDTALQRIESKANRWDFAIGYQHTNRNAEVVYWAEMHTASDSEVKVVIKKALWLLAWLKAVGTKLAAFDRDIFWVSSGATSFVLTGPQRKQLA